MQISKRKSKSKRLSLKTSLVFIGVLILAYLPFSSLLFFLKTDSFHNYFPSRFYISESLGANWFPWWNPYINFGMPQYGDMNSGFWNPITWVNASLFGYNAYTYSLELMFYLFLAGIGMFQLCRSYKFTKTVCYITGAAYLCSGYMVGHLQYFNWISGAAFLPWCIWAYNLLITKFNLKNNILCAVIFYLFISSAHPGLIIGSVYFFSAYVIYNFFQKKHDETKSFSPASFIKKNLWMTGLLLIFSLGMIYGYLDTLAYITIGKKSGFHLFSSNSFTIQSIISFLLPMAIVKNDAFFGTGIPMRNMYFGLTLFLFFIPSLTNKKSSIQKFFLYAGLFFFILSFGSVFKYFADFVLPLIGHVKMPGEFAIFACFSFTLFGAFSLNKFIADKEEFSLKLHKTYFYTQICLVLAILIGFLGIIITHNGLFFNLSKILSHPGLTPKLKSLVDVLNFYDILFLQGILQIITLGEIKKCLILKRYPQLIKIAIADLAIATLLNMPFTGVGQTSVHDVQTALNKSPEGIHAPFMLPIKQIYTNELEYNSNLLKAWSFYNKQIGSMALVNYPLQLSNTKNIFKDTTDKFTDHPYIFFTNDTAIHNLKIVNFKGGLLDFTVNSNQKDSFVFQQNIYPYWRCIINGENKTPFAYKGVFNAIEIDPGKNYVKFIFNPQPVNTTMTISLYSFLICLIYILIIMFKRPSR